MVETAANGRERPSALFVGRAEERRILADALAAAVDGRPTVVWLQGAAGSGKTTLVRHALMGLPEGSAVVRVSGDELARDVPYDLARRLGATETDNGFAVGQSLLASWSRGQEDSPVMVVLVEDAHWADDESLIALLSAVRRLEQDRVLMMITSRESADEGWQRLIRDDDHSTQIALQAFAAEDVAALARAHGVELTSRAAGRLTAHTGGNPLWVRTLLSELSPEELQAPGSLPAPRSLASAVTARLAGVPAPARALAAALAVINHESTLPVVSRVGAVDQPVQALESLLTTGFVQWDPEEAVANLAFTHPLYRQAIYEDLAPTRRRDLHRAAAAVLPPDQALAHRVAAVDGVDECLADELESAASSRGPGERALAARELLWASSVTAEASRTGHLLLRACQLFVDGGQTPRAVALRQQVEGSPDSPERDLVLGLVDWSQGRDMEAERWLTSALDHPDVSEETAGRCWAELSEIHMTRGRAADAVEAGDRALRLARPETFVERSAWCTTSLGEGMLHGARHALQRMARRLPADPDVVDIRDASLLITRAVLHHYSTQTRRAQADLQAALRLNGQRSDPFQVPRCHFLMAATLTRLGDWDTALVHARTAVSIAEDEQTVWLQAQAHAYLGILLAFGGNWADAEVHVRSASECAAAHHDLEGLVMARVAATALARARNDAEAVIDHLAPLAGPTPVYVSMQYWPWLVHAYLDLGQVAEARAVTERLEDVAARRGVDLGGQVLPLWARLAACEGDASRADALFADARTAARPEDPYLERALLHQAHGQLLVRTGRRREGGEELRAAHGMLAAVGALPFVERIEGEAAAAGVASEVSATGRGARGLTPREEDVATLVAQGLTNPEVAAQLYVSRKAVEYHLRNIFDKLGISSRRELQRVGAPA